jgi:MFS family permease
VLLLVATTPVLWVVAAVALGAGTAMVYPTLLAAAADLAAPRHRPRSLAVYRFWRDSGIVVGALSGGLTVVLNGLGAPLALAATATAVSGLLAFGIRDRAPTLAQRG